MPNKCYVAYGLVHPSKNLWTTPPDSSLQLWSVTTINRNCTVDRRLPAKAILDKTYSLLAAKAAQGPQFVLSSDKHFAHCFLNRHAEATFVAFAMSQLHLVHHHAQKCGAHYINYPVLFPRCDALRRSVGLNARSQMSAKHLPKSSKNVLQSSPGVELCRPKTLEDYVHYHLEMLDCVPITAFPGGWCWS